MLRVLISPFFFLPSSLIRTTHLKGGGSSHPYRGSLSVPLSLYIDDLVANTFPSPLDSLSLSLSVTDNKWSERARVISHRLFSDRLILIVNFVSFFIFIFFLLRQGRNIKEEGKLFFFPSSFSFFFSLGRFPNLPQNHYRSYLQGPR